jgi:DNA-binding PadR family transcriptional regulator
MQLGTFEFTVLLATIELGEDAYAVPIRAAIEARTGRAPGRGALYTTLARLEAKGLLRSRMGGATPVRGGKRKRYYRLTAAGQKALSSAKVELLDYWRSLGRALEQWP